MVNKHFINLRAMNMIGTRFTANNVGNLLVQVGNQLIGLVNQSVTVDIARIQVIDQCVKGLIPIVRRLMIVFKISDLN